MQLSILDILENKNFKSVSHFKILEYLKNNLDIFSFKFIAIDYDTIQIVDCKNDYMYFRYDRKNNKINELVELH